VIVAKGHGERLSRKREEAISALLTHRTMAAAAEAVGVNPRTLNQWLRDPDFDAAFREARRRAVDHAVSRLQRLCDRAVRTLARAMRGEDMNVAARAAKIVLDTALRGVQVDDLARRVEELDALARGISGAKPTPKT
jgi:hypothetical protein